MSGSGGVSAVTLRQPASSAGTVTFEVKILENFICICFANISSHF